MWAGLLSAAAWFAAFLLAQLAAFHLRPGQMRSRTLMRLFAAALAGHLLLLLILDLAVPGGLAAIASRLALSVICGWILMACLFVLYMPFYYTLNTSLSVETLATLARHGGRVPMSAIAQRFCSIEFLRDRLGTMQKNGYLEQAGQDAWRITRRGARVARFMLAVKVLLRLGPGG